MPKIYRIPFANVGDKQAIPISTDVNGYVSDETGFTARYELPNTDPSYLPIERAEFNGLMNDVTSALGEVQVFGFAKWQAGTWPQGARVVHNGVVYKATTTTANTPPHADWVKDQPDQVAIVQNVGQNTDRVMSQKAVTDNLNKTAIGIDQTWKNFTNQRQAGVTYTNTTGRPIMVCVSATGAVTNVSASFTMMAMNTVWLHAGSSVGVVASFTTIVPPSQEYRCSWFQKWLELR